MRLRTTATKNGRLFYVIKTYYDSHGKEHSLTVEKLGNENDIRAKYGMDPDQWAKAHTAKLNEKEKIENKPLEVSFSPSKRLEKNAINTFEVGYLFLQSLYQELGIDKICKKISKKYDFEYDLNSILSRLLYGRILHPCSKLSTTKFAATLLEKPNFQEHQVYRALDIIAKESDFIQSELFSNSFALGKRHTGVIYYDCTNYFFEMEQAEDDTLPQYGKGKENRPLPIVEMGLFMDKDGIPLSFCIHPGNTNEQVTLKPAEQKLISEFGMSKFVVCTDAGLASKANRRFNAVQQRAFITTQSIKKLPKELKEWALGASGWRILGDKAIAEYDLSKLDGDNYKEAAFYKERFVDQGTFEEKLIVTFSFKYQKYQRRIRSEQIERADKAIKNGSAKLKKRNQNDYRRFVEKTSLTLDGEIADKDVFCLDEARILEEEQYDGFYELTSNLDDEPENIISVNHQRWQIEECFRIMKSEFKARPVYLKNDDRIEAHFLTCFMALILFRYLEKKLNNKFTCVQIIQALRNMRMREILGKGYIPTYTRTELTDALHEAFHFETDHDIITTAEMKKIISKTNETKKVAKKT